MEQLQITHKLTLAEYNQLEEDTQQRYEYHDGEVFAMAGAATDVGDPVHNVNRSPTNCKLVRVSIGCPTVWTLRIGKNRC